MVAEDIIISCFLVSCFVLFCFVRHCTNKDWPIQIILPCFSIAIRSSRMSPCWMSSSWYARTDLYPASKLSSQGVVNGTKSAPFPSPLPSPLTLTHPFPPLSSDMFAYRPNNSTKKRKFYCYLIIVLWPLGLHTHRAFRLLTFSPLQELCSYEKPSLRSKKKWNARNLRIEKWPIINACYYCKHLS